jgi:oligosaccharide repeat unit polymerase
MLMIGAISFVLLIWTSRKVFSSYFNPLSFYSLVWGGMYLAYQLRLIRLPALCWYTFVVLSIGHGAFVLGCVIPAFGRTRPAAGSKAPETKMACVSTGILRKAFLILTCLYALRILVAIRDIQGFPGGFDTFINNPWLIRMALTGGEEVESYFGRGILLDLAGIGMSSLILAGYLLAVSPKKYLLFFLPAIICVADAALYTQRASAMRGLSLFVVSFLYTTTVYSKRSLTGEMVKFRSLTRRILLALLIAVVLLSVIIAVNEKILHKSASWEGQGIDAKIENPVVKKAYWYFVGSIAALDEWLQQPRRDMKMGTYTLNLLAQPLTRLGLINERELMPTHMEPVVALYTINIYTYFYPFYNDFDLIGIAVFPFVLGLVCGISYLCMRRHFSLSWLALNSVLAMTILFSFMMFVFATQRQAIFLVIAVYFIEQILTHRIICRVPSQRLDPLQ